MNLAVSFTSLCQSFFNAPEGSVPSEVSKDGGASIDGEHGSFGRTDWDWYTLHYRLLAASRRRPSWRSVVLRRRLTTTTSEPAATDDSDAASTASSSPRHEPLQQNDSTGAPNVDKRGMSEDSASVSSDTASCSTAASVSSQPMYDVFLGGSCGNTVWRRQLVIPHLKKRAISYYDPQRSVWSENMIYEESIAKENSSLFLFVLDPATVNATSFLEIAYFAARRAPKLVVVFLGKSEWREKAHPHDVPDRLRTCQLLDEILARHAVPMLSSIAEALDYIDEVRRAENLYLAFKVIIGSKRWQHALRNPQQRFAFMALHTKKALRASRIAIERATRATATRAVGAAAAGAAALDAAAVAAAQFFLPQLPFMTIILPLLIANLLVIVAIVLVERRRRSANSSLPMGPRARVTMPSLPVPRVASLTTPLKPQQSLINPTKAQLRRSKKIVDNVPVNGTVPVLPDSFRPRRIRLTRRSKGVPSLAPFVYDMFFASSCNDTGVAEWLKNTATPLLQKNNMLVTSPLLFDGLERDKAMGLAQCSRHVLYYIPNTKTFLSGMVEIAYFLGHTDWNITVCVPTEAQMLEVVEDEAQDVKTLADARASVRRRNECYAIAFCYLRDMAVRRQCRVYDRLSEAVDHVIRAHRRDRHNS